MTIDSEEERLEPIDVLIEEYLDQIRVGVPPTIDTYCNAHPELAEEIRRIFPMLAALENAAGETRVSDEYSSETVQQHPVENPSQDKGWSLPHVLGRYTLTEELGRGSMGAVYLAEDAELGRTVALKVPSFDQPNSVTVDRFRREARAMAIVKHPNLCPIYDVGQIDGIDYLTMEYIQGRPLNKLLADTEPLDTAQSVALVRQVALAVAEIHRAGVLHRDIKPSNVIVTRAGKAYLMDFGLALPREIDANLTREGEIVGSPAYLSPEQIEPEFGEVSPKSDIYALGVMLFELLTRRRPFVGSALRVMRSVVTETPPSLRSVRPGVPKALDSLCRRMLEQHPTQRIGSASNVAAELENCLQRTTDRSTGGVFAKFVAMLVVLMMVVSGIMVVVRNSRGEIHIRAPDNVDVQVEVSQKGERIAIVGPDSDWRLKLHNGEYEAQLISDDHRISLSKNRIVVSRGQTTEVEIIQLPIAKRNHPDAHRLLPPIPRPAIASTGKFIDSGQRLGDCNSLCVRLGDLDGDGDLDAFVGCGEEEPDRVWLNDGDGQFTDTGQRLGAVFTITVSLGDVDGDGDLDAFSGARSAGEQAVLWINDGTGKFTADDQSFGHVYHGALADLDADGDLDLFAARQLDANAVFFNDGAGKFADSGQRLGDRSSTYASLADLDSDGDLDAYVCNNRGTSDTVYFNDGKGQFGASPQGFPQGESSTASLVDWDGDGDKDIILAQWDGHLSLLKNDGNGNFQQKETLFDQFPYTCITAADFNGDEVLDLVSVGTTNQLGPMGVFLHQEGEMITPFEASYGLMTCFWAEAGDLDADGDLDLFAANAWGNPDRVWINQNLDAAPPNAIFRRTGEVIPGNGFWDAIPGDFDGDGDQDFFAPSDAEPGSIWLNDGDGRFVDSGQQLDQLRADTAVAADFDGDRDIDLFVTTRGSSDRIWLNDGTGQFRVTDQLFGDRWSRTPIAKDVDGDGDMDLIVVAHLGNHVVWLNDGSANFEHGQALPGDTTVNGAVADFNGDGKLDLVVSPFQRTPSLEFWFGGGNGEFERSEQNYLLDHYATIAVGEFSGDARPDVFTAGFLRVAPMKVLVGTDSGFDNLNVPLAGTSLIGFEQGDIDLDGDVDIVTGSQGRYPNEVLLNDGTGAFEHAQWLSSAHGRPSLVDLDGDGDLDLIEPDYVGEMMPALRTGRCRIWINQTIRHGGK